MTILLDVNVLLALASGRHFHHTVAVSWFKEVPPGGAIVCRLAQLGLLRLLNTPSVMAGDRIDTDDCWAIWDEISKDERIRFRQHEPSDLASHLRKYTTGCGTSRRLWTDAYLAAFAIASEMPLVTFDRGFTRFDALEVKTSQRLTNVRMLPRPIYECARTEHRNTAPCSSLHAPAVER